MCQAVETWKPVVGFEGDYEVSDQGRIRSVLRRRYVTPSSRSKPHWRTQQPKVLRGYKGVGGYLIVCLWNCTEGKKRFDKIGTFVMESFVGPRPDGTYVCHDNGDPSDNRLRNLYYGTPKQNADDKLRHGTHLQGESIPFSKLKESDIITIRNLRGIKTQREIAEQFVIAQGHVCRIQKSAVWKHVATKLDAT